MTSIIPSIMNGVSSGQTHTTYRVHPEIGERVRKASVVPEDLGAGVQQPHCSDLVRGTQLGFGCGVGEC